MATAEDPEKKDFNILKILYDGMKMRPNKINYSTSKTIAIQIAKCKSISTTGEEKKFILEVEGCLNKIIKEYKLKPNPQSTPRIERPEFGLLESYRHEFEAKPIRKFTRKRLETIRDQILECHRIQDTHKEIIHTSTLYTIWNKNVSIWNKNRSDKLDLITEDDLNAVGTSDPIIKISVRALERLRIYNEWLKTTDESVELFFYLAVTDTILAAREESITNSDLEFIITVEKLLYQKLAQIGYKIIRRQDVIPPERQLTEGDRYKYKLETNDIRFLRSLRIGIEDPIAKKEDNSDK